MNTRVTQSQTSLFFFAVMFAFLTCTTTFASSNMDQLDYDADISEGSVGSSTDTSDNSGTSGYEAEDDSAEGAAVDTFGFFAACIKGDLRSVTHGLTRGLDLNESTPLHNQTCLYLAASNNRLNVATYLLSLPGIAIENVSSLGWSPLMAAVKGLYRENLSNIAMVKLLLQHGASVRGRKGQDLLKAAARLGNSKQTCQVLRAAIRTRR